MEQRAVGGLHHSAVDGRTRWGAHAGTVGLVPAVDGDDRVVDSCRRVAHVDLAFALEGSGPYDRILGDLVPLLDCVR
jgi:hypothetical protein